MLSDTELLVLAVTAFDHACEARDWAVASGAGKDLLRATTETKSACGRLVDELRARLAISEAAACA